MKVRASRVKARFCNSTKPKLQKNAVFMKKSLILSLAMCLIALCAMAQTEEINAVKFVQGQTTDWYLLADNPEVTFTDHNPVISGKTYNLANGNVETAFGTDPLPVIKETAIADINNVAATDKEKIDGLGVDESAKSEAKAQIDNIAHTAEQTINAATSKDEVDDAKTQAIAKIYNVVQTTKDMWITVRENMTINTYGTLCWNYNLTDIDGAELYSVAGMENGRIIMEEVLAEETRAGAGYVILATAETLRVKNGLDEAQYPVPAESNNGLQGTFADITDGAAGADGNTLEGNYIIYQNEWRLCGGYTGLQTNRAYLIMKYVPGTVSAPAPGRKYISMPLPKETPTGEWRIENGEMRMDGKFIINGQLIIVKDNKMYNAQGAKVVNR